MLETILFYFFAIGAVFFSLGVILFRSPVYSVLSLVGVMAMTAGLFALLKAFLVAMILMLVYAGAILVLFLFVVMLVDFRKLSDDWKNKRSTPYWAGILSGGLLAQMLWVIGSVPASQQASLQGNAKNIGRVLFGRYVIAFELTSILLLAAVISVVVLAKKERSS